MSSICGSEQDFEKIIVESLKTDSGYISGNNLEYNKKTALIDKTFISFIKSTQPDNWTALLDKYESESEALNKLLEEFEKQRKEKGILHILRNGLKFRSIDFDVVYWKPENSLNPDTIDLYKKNIFTVINQLRTKKIKDKTAIPDIVLFINGIPFATIELKYTPQGQDYKNAEEQYSYRNPTEPLFSFKYGALVHFAVDEEYVSMTTKLCEEDTYFLPFNMGSNGAGNSGGEGNPEGPTGKADTYYLWEQTLAKDSVLDILQSFLTIEVDDNKVETLIFPRFHQKDAVDKLIADVEKNGSSKNYLIEHSAGSGKSNTIAWLAFHLQNLYFPKKNEKIFDTIIILNDRRVLDKQTRDTIRQFTQINGTVVEAKKSSDIVEGIEKGNVIIISTIQKFPMVYDQLVKVMSKNPDRRFAVIADEAHQSQSGKAAGKIKVGLGSEIDEEVKANTIYKIPSEDECLLEVAEDKPSYGNIENLVSQALDEDDIDDVPEEGDSSVKEQEKVLKEIAKGKQPNMSFFAFTATPTGETLQMFGLPYMDGKDKKYRAFHIYSMQQAIEEKFILDVLVNYITYTQYWNLRIKGHPEEKNYDQNTLTRETYKMVKQHDFRIGKICEVIVKHFEEVGCNTIGGKGKAMVVTSSRDEAVKYCKNLRSLLKDKGHEDWGVLLAISGEIDGKTEKDYNSFPENPHADEKKPISESQTAKTFKTDQYRFLVVADKYQTGFSEKKLCCMYVDKKLNGIKAVQTLSRLNRTMGDNKHAETDIYVVDFENDRNKIQKAFQTYYGAIELKGEITIDDLEKAKTAVENEGLILDEEIEAFFVQFAKKVPLLDKPKENWAEIAMLNMEIKKIIAKLVKRYKNQTEEKQKDFYTKCRSFAKKFLFLQNVINIEDEELIKYGIYICECLNPLKIKTKPGEKNFTIEELVDMSDFRLDDKITGSIKLVKGKDKKIKPAGDGTGNSVPQPITTLHKLVTELNKKYGTDFTDEDIVPAINTFKKSFEEDKGFCNKTIVTQEAMFSAKYNGTDGDMVIAETLDAKKINKKLVEVINNTPGFYEDFKSELKFPVYEHLRQYLNLA